MLFPLDIIVGFCERAGFAIIRKPKHPDALFGWISAITDREHISDRTVGKNVYVVRSLSDAPAGSVCVVTGGLPADDGVDPRSDHIFISTDLAPTEVADRIQRRLVNIIQWNDEMAQMLEEGCVNQDLLKASEPVLECYVGLSDSTFTHIAHTPNIMPLDEHSRYFVEHGYYSKRSVDIVRQSGLLQQWNMQDWTAVNNDPGALGDHPFAHRVIKQNGRYAAHLLMVSPSRIGPQHVFLFDLLAKKVEACLARHWRRENPLEQRYTYFLKEVLEGNSYDSGNIEERAGMHGLALTGIFELCLVESAWKTLPTEYFAKTVLEEMPDCKIATKGDQVAILLCMPMDGADQLVKAERRLRELCLKMDVEMGVSDTFGHLGDAAFAMEQARIALRYGNRYARRYVAFDDPGGKPDPLFRFRRFFPYFAIDPFARSEKFMAKLLASNNPIARLKSADRERGTNDFEILRVYLRSEGKINAICDAMHMHRNTVTYRLDKIRKVVGSDLEDGDTRMFLRLLYLLSD